MIEAFAENAEIEVDCGGRRRSNVVLDWNDVVLGEIVGERDAGAHSDALVVGEDFDRHCWDSILIGKSKFEKTKFVVIFKVNNEEEEYNSNRVGDVEVEVDF